VSERTTTPADARLGRVLDGKWTLERLLGVGGMASVYAARHRNGARAAVKMLHPELAKHQQIRERFLREGYAANKVEHPGAVAVLDDDIVKEGPDAGAAYIVMELLDGELLEARAARGTISERELLLIAESILDVLEAAHGRGVIHRDLKPDNLFIVKTTEGSTRVKVLDFGLARITEGRLQTRAGITLGTPAYMSPEQAGGRQDEIDGRSDLFSLGAVLFRLRTGKRIHEAASAIELVTKMAKLPAPKIREVDPSVSPSFAAIVDRAISFARDDRYPDAVTMRSDVRAALDAMEPPTVVEPPRSAGGRWLFSGAVIAAIGFGAIWVVRAGWIPSAARTNELPAASAAPPLAIADAAVADTTDAEPEDAGDAAALLVEEDAAVDVGDDAEEEEEEEEEDDDAAVDAGDDALADASGDAAEDAHDAAALAKALNDLLGPTPQSIAKKPAPTATAKAAPAPPKKKKKTTTAPTGAKKKKRRKKK